MPATAAPTRQPITAEHDAFGRQWRLIVKAGKFFGTYSPWSNSFCPAWLLIPSERAEIEALLGVVSFERPPVIRAVAGTYEERLEAALAALRAFGPKAPAQRSEAA